MERRHPSVVNVDEVHPTEADQPGAFGSTMRFMGQAAGSKQLGCRYYEVAPGKIAFPFHWHAGNEEALIVLSGTGTLRLGDAELPVRAGDYVALPVGPAHAHQLRNTGTEPLRYYGLSTLKYPEVVLYPDSKKVGLMAFIDGQVYRKVYREEDTCDYFDREPLAEKR